MKKFTDVLFLLDNGANKDIINLLINEWRAANETNEKRRIMMALSWTHKEWEKHMRKCALEIGVPDSYRTAIMFLSRNPGANQKMMAEFANKTTAAINQTVKEMQLNGYIRKETDENDQRYTKLFLTEKGMEKAELLRARLRKSDDLITSAITEEREQEMIEMLNMLCNVIRRDL